MKCLHIVDWDRRYEVNDKGRPWESGEDKRKGPLPYIRMPAHGRKKTDGYEDMLRVARRSRAAIAMGVWTALMEIAADDQSDRRGYIVVWRKSRRQLEPATVEDLMRWTGFSRRHIEIGLEILTHPDTFWVEYANFRDVPGESGEVRGGTDCFLKTKQNKTRQNKTHTKRPGKNRDADGGVCVDEIPEKKQRGEQFDEHGRPC